MEVGVFEAKTRLSELLGRAENGEEVVITRRGEPVARLQALTRVASSAQIEALLKNVRQRREGMSAVGNWKELKQDVDEGRP
jgi:prevent-host-death family protein